MSRARAAVIEAAVVELVAALPELPVDRLRVLAGDADAIADDVTGGVRALARALAAALRRYAGGAAPLEGWGLVAAAADTLGRALDGEADPTALAASCFELDSLAATARPAAAASPDVPAASLRRRS